MKPSKLGWASASRNLELVLSAKSRHLRFFLIAVIGFVRNFKASVDLNGEYHFGLEFR
jgi:hypothetical protein